MTACADLRLALAAAKYLCRWGSAGVVRMALDLLRDKSLAEVWAALGIDPRAPDVPRAAAYVRACVQYLQQRGVAEYVDTVRRFYDWRGPKGEGTTDYIYLSGLDVANWKGKPCREGP
jgi:hypothetical protein